MTATDDVTWLALLVNEVTGQLDHHTQDCMRARCEDCLHAHALATEIVQTVLQVACARIAPLRL
jgi:hypothetical protein